MNFWEVVAPAAPRPGWPGRRAYLARQLAAIVLQGALLFLVVAVLSVYVLSLTPEV